jgi:oligogalacturonide transport system substrate-binding protein
MKSMKWLCAATSVVMAGMVASSAFAADSVEIRMSWWGGDSRHKATQEAIKLFEEKYPNIKVKAEFTGWTGHQERITTQISGNTEPDLMQINWPWLPIFSPDGNGFADLYQFKDIIDLSQWNVDLLDYGTMGNKLNGLPISITGRVFFLNKTTYDKAGVAIPKTWDELFAAADTFKAKLGDDYFPFDSTSYNAWLMTCLYATQQTGKSFIDPQTNKIAWTKEQLAKALTFYQSLADKHVLKSLKEAASEGNVMLHEKKEWMEGKLGGSYEWDSTYWKYSKPIKDGDLEPVPTLMSDGAVSEGLFRKPTMTFAISKNSQHQKEAAMLLNFLLNDDAAIRVLHTTRGIPASKKAEALLMKEGLIDDKVAAAHAIITGGEAPAISQYFEHPKLQDMYRDVVEQMAYKRLTPDEAAEKVLDEGSMILRRITR